MAQILIIEDNPTMREGMMQVLTALDHQVYGAHNGKEGLQYFEMAQSDLVITDLKMDGLDGMQVLQEIKKQSPDTLVLMITAFGTIELAVQAMQLGAFDFIAKPFSPDLLRVKVRKALDFVKTKAENQYLRQEQMKELGNLMIGQSPQMKDLYAHIEKIAPTDTTVLLMGEQGTGKDMIARTIHQHSYRKNKSFIKVDASTITQSQLFGHERGAFEGALTRTKGLLELADGGTLFIDELTEMPLELQKKLCNVLQNRHFQRLGSDKTIHVDIRFIGTVSHNIEDQIAQKKFRKDLYNQLHATTLRVAPLRDRSGDIPMLINHFLAKMNQTYQKNLDCSPDVINALQSYAWPGNMDELASIIKHLVINTHTQMISTKDLPQEIHQNSTPKINNPDISLEKAVENLEKQMILEAYKKLNGNETKIAKKLGINAQSLYGKLKKYDIS